MVAGGLITVVVGGLVVVVGGLVVEARLTRVTVGVLAVPGPAAAGGATLLAGPDKTVVRGPAAAGGATLLAGPDRIVVLGRVVGRTLVDGASAVGPATARGVVLAVSVGPAAGAVGRNEGADVMDVAVERVVTVEVDCARTGRTPPAITTTTATTTATAGATRTATTLAAGATPVTLDRRIPPPDLTADKATATSPCGFANRHRAGRSDKAWRSVGASLA